MAGYFRSSLTKEERIYWNKGDHINGNGNDLVKVFRIIGKFKELEEVGQSEDILRYDPIEDNTFKHENMGITEISSYIRSNKQEYYISRRFIKNLARKWKGTRVRLSYKSDLIIRDIIGYISLDNNRLLKEAVRQYIAENNGSWASIIPIQYAFLNTRHLDGLENSERAGEIIGKLELMEF